MTLYAVENSDWIKIGWTTNLETRLSALRTSSPVPLNVLLAIDGGRREEAFLHDKLQDHRAEGEWFSKTEAVLQEIASLREQGIFYFPWPVREPEIETADEATGHKLIELCQHLVIGINGRDWDGNKQRAIKIAAERSGLAARTIKSILYTETVDISVMVFLTLRLAFMKQLGVIPSDTTITSAYIEPLIESTAALNQFAHIS